MPTVLIIFFYFIYINGVFNIVSQKTIFPPACVTVSSRYPWMCRNYNLIIRLNTKCLHCNINCISSIGFEIQYLELFFWEFFFKFFNIFSLWMLIFDNIKNLTIISFFISLYWEYKSTKGICFLSRLFSFFLNLLLDSLHISQRQ